MMWLKIISVLILIFLRVAILEEVHQNDFATVSTTQRPSDIQQLINQVAKIEEQLTLYTKLNENARHTETINTKITRIQEKLESLANAQTNSYLRLETVNIKLDKIQEKFESFTTSDTQKSLKLANIDKEMTDIREKLQIVINSGANQQLTQKLPKNCKEVQERGYNVTGIYSVQPEFAPEAFLVRCNMDLRGGGWTYLHNKYDGKQDFYLGWKDYKQGFGNLAGEFWLGLDRLQQLTGHEVNELLVELVDWDLKKVYAHYDVFSIGNEDEGYYLKALGKYSGDGGDSLSYQASAKFTTKDKDQDSNPGNCATAYAGAWWFKSCFTGHLNGQYLTAILKEPSKNKGLSWRHFRGDYYSLKEARMMVKPQHKN